MLRGETTQWAALVKEIGLKWLSEPFTPSIRRYYRERQGGGIRRPAA